MRYADWTARVGALMLSRLDAPFVWGRNDCCLFAADTLLAASGADPAEGIRGTYDSAISAARVVDRLGGMESIGDQSFGSVIDPNQAVFGDIGLVDNEGRPCLGVFGGEYFHAPAEHGLTIFERKHCKRAWRLTD